jgi:menaquinone-dependent protoporphyrinogen oxidase
MRILIAYSTVDGHTFTISQRLQKIFEQGGHDVHLVDLRQSSDVDTTACDRIVIGASIRYGKHREEVYRFIATHRDALERKPSAFFSVSLVARKPGKDSADSNPYLLGFRRTTTWAPAVVGVFAGKLDYQRYGFVDRRVIQLIMWITQGPTHAQACVDFTDWPAVERFAQQVTGA